MNVSVLLGVCALFLSAGSSDGEEVLSVPVSVEGDPVTINTDVTVTPQQNIKWYFNDTRIAQIIGGQSYICSDSECPETFRDRLKLDHQTGSLTIMNSRTTDSGLYRLQIISNTTSNKIFSVTVIGVSGADTDGESMSVMEGDPVTLNTGVTTNQHEKLKWYFNKTQLAQISGNQSKICTDDECKERFRDRLKLDHQTGSLTITDTRTTDSGEYTLQIINNNSISLKIFNVTLTVVSDPGLSPAAIAGICVGVAVLLFIAAAAAACYRKCQDRTKKDIEMQHNQGQDQKNDTVEDSSPDPTDPLMNHTANVTSPNTTVPLMNHTANVTSPNTTVPLMNHTANVTSPNTTVPLMNHTANVTSPNTTVPLMNHTANRTSPDLTVTLL